MQDPERGISLPVDAFLHEAALRFEDASISELVILASHDIAEDSHIKPEDPQNATEHPAKQLPAFACAMKIVSSDSKPKVGSGLDDFRTLGACTSAVRRALASAPFMHLILLRL